MWRVKICGNRTAAEGIAAAVAGADAVGVIAGVRHRSEDALSAEAAAEVLVGATALRPAPRTVLVTHLRTAAEVVALHRRVGAGVIQLHDDVSPDEIRKLRRALPRAGLVKAVHVVGPEAERAAIMLAPEVDALLLDSRTDDRIGGTGRVHDWRIAAAVVRAVAPSPVILAGGLTPGNVAAAVEVVRPWGVDVNTGVDDDRGAKDVSKMERFVLAAKAALGTSDAQL